MPSGSGQREIHALLFTLLLAAKAFNRIVHGIEVLLGRESQVRSLWSRDFDLVQGQMDPKVPPPSES
jgi:hypothetical protein